MISTIFYHPEPYSTSGPRLMGRNAAGESFLKGFLTHSKSSEFWAYVQDPSHAKEFSKKVEAVGRSERVLALGSNSIGNLSRSGMLFYPGPDISMNAHKRSAFGHASWSLCGITHTTASARAMAQALPIPLPAPVTTAVLFFKL